MNFINKKKFIAPLLCLFICLLIPFTKNKQVFLSKTNIDDYAKKYANSQYIKGDASPRKITDGELYTYAGYAYVRGEDPTTINFEHPPLIKYFFGFSYLIFGNSAIVSLIFYAIFLFSFYLFSGLVLTNKLLRYLAVVVLGLQPIVYTLASQILLDLPLNFLVLFLFYFLFKKNTSLKKKYILIGIILGFLGSVKYPFPFLLLPIFLISLTSYLNKELKYLILPLLIAPTIYLTQYLMFFFNGHSFTDLIMFEKYRFSWWMGDRTMPRFLIFENLFTGKFTGWWDNKPVVKNENWNLLLPITFVSYLGSFFVNKKNRTNCILFLYSLAVIILYGIGSATYLRYLTQLIPFWIALIFSAIENLFIKKRPI